MDWIGPLSAVIYDGAGWPIIVFNGQLLIQNPPILELFAYYHECAHLTVPTRDEALANCEALIAMRRAGDVTPEQEAVLGDIHYHRLGELGPEYGGGGRALWDATVACADKPL